MTTAETNSSSVNPNFSSVRADFSLREVCLAADAQWLNSPSGGVIRRMLDRIGGEVARATSVVRYAPGAQFPTHVHGGGEEILVLDGIFSDEQGDYPEGSYLRNPPGSSHAPFSREGCTLLVKLWQFTEADSQSLRLNTREIPWRQGMVEGLTVMPLHSADGVDTALVKWAPNTHFNPHTHPGGEEIFVLDGVFSDEQGDYPAGSWLRSPRWSRHQPFTRAEGALIYVKVGHLDAPMVALPS